MRRATVESASVEAATPEAKTAETYKALPAGLIGAMSDAMRMTSAGQPFSWENAARAALDVLRRPTDEMLAAGRNAFPGICGVMHTGGEPEGQPLGLYNEERTLTRVRAVFRRMLDAAEGIELYRPSNGFEGERFMCRWCARCSKDNLNHETGEGDGCEIIAYTMALDEDDDDYPRAWRIGPDGEPICTEFLAKTMTDAEGTTP